MTIERTNEIDKIMENPESDITSMEYDPETWGYCYGWLFGVCAACHKEYRHVGTSMLNALRHVEPAVQKIMRDYKRTIDLHVDEDTCKNLMAYLLMGKQEGKAAGKIKNEIKDAAVLGLNKTRKKSPEQ